MRRTGMAKGWKRAAFQLGLLGLLALPAWGQSCALCYTQAAGAGPRMIQALKSGILVLIFPPMGICIGLMVISYKKRNQFGERSNSERKADRGSDLGW
jgi:hypothetical protein